MIYLKLQRNIQNLEDLVFRMNLTYNDFEKISEMKYHDSDQQIKELPPTKNEVVDFNKTFPPFITITVDDIRLKTVFTIVRKAPLKNFFEMIFHTILGFNKIEYFQEFI